MGQKLFPWGKEHPDHPASSCFRGPSGIVSFWLIGFGISWRCWESRSRPERRAGTAGSIGSGSHSQGHLLRSLGQEDAKEKVLIQQTNTVILWWFYLILQRNGWFNEQTRSFNHDNVV
jgi:hypothetical protein